jgi:hypothetical protein
MKVFTQSELMEALIKRFPDIWIKKGEEFSDEYKNCIWTVAEGETFINKSKDIYAFNVSGSIFFDHRVIKKYNNEVHNTLHNFLNKRGWYTESYDTATFFFVPIKR